MNEAQAVNLAPTTIPTMIVILIGIFTSNARLSDVKEALRAEMEKTIARCCIALAISTRDSPGSKAASE